ncbi:MAG: winged helix DNA-binding domain-containing protein [Chloroflexota bacterium]
MAVSDIAAQRLYNQKLEHSRLRTPGEVVAWLGAVQAQEYALAKWALGLRLQQARDDLVEQAFTEGAILRTHVLRPTWHFVTPDDIRWLLALTAPRVNAVNAGMYRQLELDEALFLRSNAVIARELGGGRQLTRVELGAALAQAGILATGQRLAYIVHRAELDAIVCSGARRGKQFTYALLAERAPRARVLARDEALAELVRRYFTSRGPATAQDFARWSGLTVADAKTGLALARPHLVQESLDGQTYWRPPALATARPGPPRAHLLAPYDEYTIAYRHHSAVVQAAYLAQARGSTFTAAFAIEGQILGMWRRTFARGAVLVEAAPFRPLAAAEGEALAAAAQRFGAFLGTPVELQVSPALHSSR